MKSHQNPSSGRRVVPYGRTDVTKLTVASRNFANAPKNILFLLSVELRYRPARSLVTVYTELTPAPISAYKTLNFKITSA